MNDDPMEHAWRAHTIRRNGRELPNTQTPFRDALLNALARIGNALERHADRAGVGIVDDPVDASLAGGGSISGPATDTWIETYAPDPTYWRPGCDPREIPPSSITTPQTQTESETESETETPPDALTAEQLDALPVWSIVETWSRWWVKTDPTEWAAISDYAEESGASLIRWGGPATLVTRPEAQP